MVKHVVLFKMKPFASAAERSSKLTEIKVALEDLINTIEVLRSIEVGINLNPAEEYDLALYTTFDKMEDVAVYAAHPDHVVVAKTFIAPIKEARACVDYQL